MAVILFNLYLEDNGDHIFCMGISPEVAIIAQLEFKLVHLMAGIYHFSHNARGIFKRFYFCTQSDQMQVIFKTIYLIRRWELDNFQTDL